MGYTVERIEREGNRVVAVVVRGPEGVVRLEADYVFSTMPVSELIGGMDAVPQVVSEVARDLPYRDFITVGVLAKKLALGDGSIPDTWIYIHEPSVTMCRIQFFNNWSPHLVADPTKQWFGLEYIISTKDALWQKSDEEVKKYAREELQRLDLVKDEDIEDMTVVRMEKTYPAYFGTYESFDQVRDFLNTIENLYPIGRNGMHRYNNQDHSMLVAMVAVDNILEGRTDKQNLWEVNAEQEYHEEKK